MGREESNKCCITNVGTPRSGENGHKDKHKGCQNLASVLYKLVGSKSRKQLNRVRRGAVNLPIARAEGACSKPHAQGVW